MTTRQTPSTLSLPTLFGGSMAKKYTARVPGTVAIRLDVPPETRDALRVLAATAGVPMSQYVRDIVVADVKKKSQKK